MSPRLPAPGGDQGTWGNVLNEFLQVAHKPDGSIADGSITDAQIASGANIAQSKIAGLTSNLADKADTAAAVLKAIATAKGDILAATASQNITRVPVGADSQVLTADSSAATGVAWADLPDTLFIDATRYGVNGNTTTDFSVQLAQAATDAAAAGGGIIILPPGTIHAANIPIKSNVTWRGYGRNATIVKLPNGSTGNVFKGDNLDTLEGTTNGGGPYGWTIRDLSIDGNKANCPSGGRGIAVFGYEFHVTDIDIYGCKSDGFYACYMDTTAPPYTTVLMESYVTRVKVFDCDANGFNVKGSHDSVAESCIAARNQLANFNAGGESWSWVSCHAWGYSNYAWYLQGDNLLVNCQGEGATIAQFFVEWHNTRIIGGAAFFPGSASAVGIKIGDASHAPENCQITGLSIKDFSSASGAAIDLTYAGPGLRATIFNDQPSGTSVIGSLPADALIDIQTKGAAVNGSLFQRPGYQILPSTSVILPPAFYDSFTAADGAALDSVKWTVAAGGASDAAVVINQNRARFTSGATGGYDDTDRVFAVSTLATSLIDVEQLFKLEWGTVTTESYFFAFARSSTADIQNGATGYSITIGNTSIDLESRVSGTKNTLWTSNFPGIGCSTPANGSKKWIRFRVSGTSISVKVWDDGAAEPSYWSTQHTDSAVSAGGRVGFNIGGGNAAAAGIFYLDNAQYFAL